MKKLLCVTSFHNPLHLSFHPPSLPLSWQLARYTTGLCCQGSSGLDPTLRPSKYGRHHDQRYRGNRWEWEEETKLDLTLELHFVFFVVVPWKQTFVHYNIWPWLIFHLHSPSCGWFVGWSFYWVIMDWFTLISDHSYSKAILWPHILCVSIVCGICNHFCWRCSNQQ